MRRLIAALCLLLAAAASAQDSLVLAGGRILDPAGQSWVDGRAILVRDGKIQTIAALKDLPQDPKPIDCSGLFLIPGLIDLHTHLLLHPYNEAKWDDQVLRESLELRTIRAVAAARATVRAGFTTIRDLGTEGAGFADVALRDAVRQGLMEGPRIFASTRAIVATGCYGPAGFDPRWEVPQGAQEATGADGLRLAVRQQIAAGADWVKLYADYRRGPGSPTPTFSLDELKAAVDEARSAGKPVAVHATTDEGIRRAVLAGVNTIEHGYGASRETFQLMKDKGIALCPTMAAAEAVALYSGWTTEKPAPPSVQQSRDSLKLAREVGVTIACGSDAGVFAHGTNARELELMVAAGMTPAEALRSATSTAARVLDREKDLGRLDTGFAADIVALKADPLQDIGALRRIAAVITRGRLLSEAK
jgi:imidazolonepropionase-like amidohydrolase